ncbi:MAG: tRNA (guanine(26)-N(2))-dimethyltransferase [Candidatus Nanoarchaeia archaeon]|nr:tRNA (guanine(26)-N(2))-dimethyltransferase [Candidatus Nanoarchaeia archaeon]
MKSVFNKEGLFEIKAPEGKISSKLPGFYNPRKTFDRDLCIDILSILKPKKCLDLLSATGSRGIRITGIKGIEEVYMNDKNPKAVELIKENINHNKKLIKAKTIVSNEYAQEFLYKNRIMFDYIDIDPFGTPIPFLESAITFLKNRGYLGVTATDSSALVGTYPKACMRKYHSKVYRTPYYKETGIRILINYIIMKGAESEKALTPVFSYSKDDYFRIYFKCETGAGKTDSLLKKTGYLTYCPSCLETYTSENPMNCEKCRTNSAIGRLWLGDLWDKELLSKISLKHKIVERIKEESRIQVPYYYEIPVLIKNKKAKQMKFEEQIRLLREKGFKASRTHFSEQALRTNAKIKDFK